MHHSLAAAPAVGRKTTAASLSPAAQGARRLSWVVAGLMAVQASIGVLAPSIYRDVESGVAGMPTGLRKRERRPFVPTTAGVATLSTACPSRQSCPQVGINIAIVLCG
jgi:hypothetical protein